MKSLFEDSFSRVWHDGASPIVFIRFTQILDKKNFIQPAKTAASFAKHLLRVNKNAYALIDLTDFVCVCPKISEHFYHWLSQLHKSGIEFTAVVKPKSKETESEDILSIKKSHVSWFSCFEKALRNINTQMTMNLLTQ